MGTKDKNPEADWKGVLLIGKEQDILYLYPILSHLAIFIGSVGDRRGCSYVTITTVSTYELIDFASTGLEPLPETLVYLGGACAGGWTVGPSERVPMHGDGYGYG